MAIGSHQSPKMINDEWLTPLDIILRMGVFNLDPCSPITRPWDTAITHYDKTDDGLSKEWFGRVWLNPPYGKHTKKWMGRLASHGNGVALIFARTETVMFFDEVWGKASSVLFIKGRLHFHYVGGGKAPSNSGAPSVLVAYGENNAHMLAACGIQGHHIYLNGVAH